MRIGVDTETTGVDLYHASRPFLTTITLESDLERPLYWEWDVNPLTREVIVPKNDIKEIADVISDPSVTEIILQNAKFDITALAQIGLWDSYIPLTTVWPKLRDTLRGGHLLASGQLRDLTTLCLVYLNLNLTPWEAKLIAAAKEARKIAQQEFPGWRIAKKETPGMPSASGDDGLYRNDYWLPRAIAKAKGYLATHPWWTVLSDYACLDSSSILPLWDVIWRIIQERNLEAIYNESLNSIRIAYGMEKVGITYNDLQAKALRGTYQEEADNCEQVCINLSDGNLSRLSVGVTNELKTTLFDHFQLVSPGVTDKGNPSLDKNAMEYWMDTLPSNSKAKMFVQKTREFRQRVTAINYLKGYDRYAHVVDEAPDWRRLHPSLNPTGSSTLRWSSSSPNEQNISKKEGFNLRSCFGPLPGREWWSLDAKNIELRIPAYEAGETLLIDLFEKPDEPPYYGSNHLLNFSTVYDDLWNDALKSVGLEEVGPYCKKRYASTWYQRAKNGWFAIQYGAVDKANGTGTADRAFGRPGSHSKLKSRLGRLEQLNRSQIAFANARGYVETIPDRNVDPKRGYPLQVARTDRGTVLETIPLSYHVQGTAMWWMLKAMNRCDNFLQQWNGSGRIHQFVLSPILSRMRRLGYYLVMQVHDELVFDFPQGQGEEPWKTNLPVIREIKRLMELGGSDIGVPTEVSVEYHADYWNEGKTIKDA
jgi:DNA polymerase I-like protein with 3'-5' exonuclease and polymerase domains